MTIRQKLLFFFLLMSGFLIVLMASLWMIVDSANILAETQKRRNNSYRLADELRQSSDDLTRMVRTYVVTGDKRFKQYFEDIIAIRDGKIPRPEEYQGIYWDFITHTHTRKKTKGKAVAIIRLMKKLGFTKLELSKLSEAKALSDKLINMEVKAMKAMEGRFESDDGKYNRLDKPNQELARQITHGPAYHQAKAEIMKPINDFLQSIELRTSREVLLAKTSQYHFIIFSIIIAVLLIITCFVGYHYFKRGITSPLRQMLEWTKKLENGDYDINADFKRKDELGLLTRAFVNMAQLISKQVSELQERAIHDDLTGAVTKEKAVDYMTYCIRNTIRTKTKVGIIFMDLNQFKKLNDDFGHLIGDEVLKACVERSRLVLRDTDLVCRVGGDEFLFIFPNIKDKNEMRVIADKINKSIAEPLEIDGLTVSTSVSLGISVFPDDGNDINTLIDFADKKMYKAKRESNLNHPIL